MAISQIHNVYKKLTETEKKLASYILSNPEKVVRMTAKELADSCSTAPSAVIRLCKSVGLAGFSDLKISLAGAYCRHFHPATLQRIFLRRFSHRE